MGFVKCDFSEKTGQRIKPLHAVNNGPHHTHHADQNTSNLQAFKDAGIPYVRTHDASIYYSYGREHCVDVNGIFPDFDADPYNEKNYDFVVTDEYIRVIILSGAKPFYRLGSCIEHWVKKYNTLPPKDFKKWAVICEHIIRHYTEGWANGFFYDMPYWEIWNEPDLDPDDSANKRTWGGTKAQFFELYDITANHLKKCFPHLKIGGPAAVGDAGWVNDFLSQLKAPLDFFSWHTYATKVENVADNAKFFRSLLDKFGYTETASILNEWNYVSGWFDDDWTYSIKTMKGLKGASFISSVMCACQDAPLDMLMYYDARPGTMNGLFDSDIPSQKLKGYYSMLFFNELYKLGGQTRTDASRDLYSCAASDGKDHACMFSYYSESDTLADDKITLSLEGMDDGEKELSVYMTDSVREGELLYKIRFKGERIELDLHMPLYATYLVTIKMVQK